MSRAIFSPNEPIIDCHRFSRTEILLATDSFSDDQVIGKGGFGKVYKGLINNGSTTVAIKRLNAESKQGAHEFWTEIITLLKLRYTHLVTLIGYSDEDEMILVYEYIPKGTLAEHLYRSSREEDPGDWYQLTWEQRLNICIGAALGLQYLHENSIIHRDVKTANILLDENWVAKIADFGLSRMTHMQSHVSTDVKGTFGYLDPEYFLTHRLTIKSDVYAFGVVLLEVLCSRPPVDTSFEEVERRSLALWAKKCFKKGRLLDMIHPSLKEQVSPSSLKMFSKVAIGCLNKDPRRRPNMAEVVRSLQDVLASESNARKNKGIVAGFSSRITSIFRNGKPDGNVLPGIAVTCTRRFTLTEVRAATNNFNRSQMITSGYHADVYRGLIDGGTREVAIKRWTEGISQHPLMNLIRMEIEVQSQLHDLDLASLIGYYIHEHEAGVVYDYMANRSLHYHLYKTENSALSWEKRLEICLCIGRALHYLHARWSSTHWHLKLADILLDENQNPKICGFVFPSFTHDESEDYESDLSSKLFAATKQYMDPEFYVTCRFSDESDVYSFGVILLELLCGRHLLIDEGFIRVNIASWFTENWVDGLPVLTDPCLSSLIAPKCLDTYVLLALSCVNFDRVKRPTMGSVLISLERALQVQRIWLEQQSYVARKIQRTKLGSDVSNLISSSRVISGMGSKGKKLSLVALEIANTIARGANLMESLVEENIKILKTEILHSEGVRLLVSVDMKELLSFAAADKREEFDVFCDEVTRFRDLCKDPQWHNLGRDFFPLWGNAPAVKKERAEAEKILEQLTTLAQHISIGTRFSPDIEELKSIQLLRKGESVTILQSELKHQRKVAESLKRKSLWAKSLEKVVEKLVDLATFIQQEIFDVFSNSCLMTPGNKPERLGVANLALHYANVINRIDEISSRPMSFPPSMRDQLYQGLPNSVKVALSSRCEAYKTTEELTIPQIKAEMEKTLNWLVPVATNTTNFHLKRAHQGFGCTEFGKNGSLDNSIIRLQTLHHAEKEKVDHYILELVTWLHRLVTVARERDYRITTLPRRTPACKSLNHTDTKTPEERHPLEKKNGVQEKGNLGLSKSQEFISMKSKGSRFLTASKSTGKFSDEIETSKF